MKVIIAGSRGISEQEMIAALNVCAAVRPEFFNGINIVLSGGARGADRFGETWATLNGISIERYPANWNLFGKKAGYLRNVTMAENADALIAVWDGSSRGTKHMIDIARKKGLYIFTVNTCDHTYTC